MPKLTNREYFLRHNVLARLWDKDKRAYYYLSYQQQRDLHDYYVPTRPLSELELMAHRKRVTKQNPSLPQRAGRAFGAMYRGEFTPVPVTTGRGDKQVFIRGLASPELDIAKLSKLLSSMLKTMTPEERAQVTAEGEKVLSNRKRAA